MDVKETVLIVESKTEWLGIIRQALPKDRFDIQIARTIAEASFALQNRKFTLAIVDPVFEGQAETSGQDGLSLVTRIVLNYPETRVLLVSGTVGREMLRNAPEIPITLPVVTKQNWNQTTFLAAIDEAMKSEHWGPRPPFIEQPESATENEPSTPMPPRPGSGLLHYAGLTGPLSQTGNTGPLNSGLIPPVVGSRPGAPRILIVEGKTEWQQKFAALLEREKFFWRVATDDAEAMERLRLESFHVVLLDLMVGEAGASVTQGKGFPVLEYLISESPKTKVIIASAHVSRSDLAKLFMRYPLKGFIDKNDFNATDLLEAILEQNAGPSLRIQTLGDFRIWRDEKAITDFGDTAAEQLIKILLTRQGEKVSVEELIECLWPGSDPKATSPRLGTVISSARNALEPDLPRPNDSHFILRVGANYQFNTLGKVEIDVEQFRRLISEARQHERQSEPDDALQDYEAARVLYQGDYLPEQRSERWAIQERTALQSLYTTALNRIADIYSSRGRVDLAIEAASRSLQVDAYNESTYRRLMRYHTCNNDRQSAVSVYRTLVKLFSEFFGEEPNTATSRLFQDIEAGTEIDCIEAMYGSGEWRLHEDH
jgi:DNA-binding SARP family transcriptional activator/ActR/RegA family two-component response regulator